jgi:hypothetical protein
LQTSAAKSSSFLLSFIKNFAKVVKNLCFRGFFCTFVISILLYDEEKTVNILHLISDFDVGHKYRFMSAKGVGG